MSGINTLVKGAVGTLAKDKVASYLSPAQMDFITFALNPQGYLLDKGVNAAANALGYGSQYRELKGGAEADKEYYTYLIKTDDKATYKNVIDIIDELNVNVVGKYVMVDILKPEMDLVTEKVGP